MPQIKILTKAKVMKLLEDEYHSPPTFTDDEHQADWWNRTFGQGIKQEWEQKIDELMGKIELMQEEREFYDV